jgi:hypothetical protein
MNTQDARREMHVLADEGLSILNRLQESRTISLDDRNSLRRMANEARSLLSEAGYPGEAVWRGLQRASIGVDTNFQSHDLPYWHDVQDELERGAETLASLDTASSPRDADFHIVG